MGGDGIAGTSDDVPVSDLKAFQAQLGIGDLAMQDAWWTNISRRCHPPREKYWSSGRGAGHYFGGDETQYDTRSIFAMVRTVKSQGSTRPEQGREVCIAARTDRGGALGSMDIGGQGGSGMRASMRPARG